MDFAQTVRRAVLQQCNIRAVRRQSVRWGGHASPVCGHEKSVPGTAAVFLENVAWLDIQAVHAGTGAVSLEKVRGTKFRNWDASRRPILAGGLGPLPLPADHAIGIGLIRSRLILLPHPGSTRQSNSRRKFNWSEQARLDLAGGGLDLYQNLV